MKIFRRRSRIDIIIERTYSNNGVVFSIIKNNSRINLPFQFSITEWKQIENIDKLQLIEDLYFDDILQEIDEHNYVLKYDDLYQLTVEEREILNLPHHTSQVTIKLENEGIVGSHNFKFIPRISSRKHKRLDVLGKRKGAVIELPNKDAILLEEPFYHFLEFLDDVPDSKNTEEVMSYVAEVKKGANLLGIELSQYIENENYEFVDELDIELKRDEEGVEIIPRYKHETLDDETLNELADKEISYAQKGKKRILVKQTVKKSKEKINEMPKIENKDIPRLVQNPEIFYDEEIGVSLEDFSDRVKDLKIRVYRAQPFIHAEQTDRGWFNYSTGYKIKDIEGNELSTEDETFFADSLDDDFKQLDENTFIELPDQTSEFQELARKVKNESSERKTKISQYVLEIFENFSQVDYNKPLLAFKEELSKEKIFDTNPPREFKANLKPFQADGFKWMKTLRATGNGGLLADDMGLGKTVQVIAFLLYLKEQEKLMPTLIVLPKSLIDNWINEINKFAPTLSKNLYIHTGTGRYKNEKIIGKFDIVLTTYQTLTKDQMILGKIDWEMVILDEAQHIKNPTTAISNAVKAMKNKGRLALTGTPVENNLTDLWSIIDFVQPGLFGSLKNFRDTYEKNSNYDQVQAELENKMKFIYLRRTKEKELKGQLPDKDLIQIYCNFGEKQQHKYEEIILDVKEKRISGLQAIQKLKKICSHPGLDDENLQQLKVKEVPKLAKTLELLQQIKRKNEKVIIFTEYRKMQAILKREIINMFGINPAIINGETSHRQLVVDKFNNMSGFDVLILSPRAAGTGLTITGANHVVHYTRWWNPAVENQATDRAYRIGQEKNVKVYYPIVKASGNDETVEEIIDKLIREKQTLAHNIIVPSQDLNIEQEVLQYMKVS